MIGLIPAAGSGTRMYPFTKAIPKELFPIRRKAVIDHVIESLHKFGGANKIFIVVGERKGNIIDHVGNGSDDLNIAYLFQEKREGLAHAIYQGKPWIHEDFIVHVGDAFLEPKDDIKKAVEIHEKEKPFATIIAREVEDPTKYGILKVNEKNELTDTIEKPSIEEAKSFRLPNGKYLVNLGIYIFNPKYFHYFTLIKPGKKNEYQVPDVFKKALENGERIKVFITKGKYLDLGNWNDAEKAWLRD